MQKLISQGALKQDEQPNFYLYRQIMGKHSQVGLVAAASCEEYLAGIIKKHEFTRPDKEDDRVRHIEALEFADRPGVSDLSRGARLLTRSSPRKFPKRPPWISRPRTACATRRGRFRSADEIKFVETQFAQIPFLYIADGHHRSAAAARVFQSRHGAGHSGQFLAVIFPHNQMQILPYNRVLKDLNGHSPEQLLKKLEAVFDIKPGNAVADSASTNSAFILQGQWRTLTFKPQFTAASDPIERLDVTMLQKQILAPVFGIDDPRTSKKINFVGGIRGTAELEKLVNSGEYACAFSMFPTSIEDLMSIADAGGIMPPKSTWFEPKLRDAMFCHLI